MILRQCSICGTKLLNCSFCFPSLDGASQMLSGKELLPVLVLSNARYCLEACQNCARICANSLRAWILMGAGVWPYYSIAEVRSGGPRGDVGFWALESWKGWWCSQGPERGVGAYYPLGTSSTSVNNVWGLLPFPQSPLPTSVAVGFQEKAAIVVQRRCSKYHFHHSVLINTTSTQY